MRWKHSYAELLTRLASLPPEPDRKAALEVIQTWLKEALLQWPQELRRRYGLDDLATLKLEQFPIGDSSLETSIELLQLRRVPPTSLETFAMRLRDLLWEGVTVESPTPCPRCGEARLRVLEDPTSRSPVLACDACGWAQKPNGEQWHGDRALGAAPTELVNRWRAESHPQRHPS